MRIQHRKKLAYIVTTYPALINAKDKDGNTPLHLLAPRCGHNVLKAINLLLKKGAELNINLNIKNNDNKPPYRVGARKS